MSADVPDPDIKIDDPEDLSQTQRIQELLDRRRKVLDARDELYDLTLLDDQDRDDVRRAYRSRVESLIMDVWATLQASAEIEDDEEAASDGGLTTAEKYLDREVIATVEVPAPDIDEGNLGPKQPAPEPQLVQIQGLRWFLENGHNITRTFEVRTFDPPETDDEVQEIPVPMRALDQALLTIFEWVREAGIDADLEQSEQRTQVTEEALGEVDEWRKQILKEMDN